MKPALIERAKQAAEGARRRPRRALLRPPGPAGPRAVQRRHRLRFARDGALRATSTRGKTVVVAGVRFMGETAKILNPEKQRADAGPAGRVLARPRHARRPSSRRSATQHPDRVGRRLRQHQRRGEGARRLDGHLVHRREDRRRTSTSRKEDPVGARQAPGRTTCSKSPAPTCSMWNAACVVHDEFKAQQLEELKAAASRTRRCWCTRNRPQRSIALADAVGSTTGIIQAAERLGAKEYIVATDGGIIHQMKKRLPGVTFIEAPTAGKGATCQSCAHCPVDGDERTAQPARDARGRAGPRGLHRSRHRRAPQCPSTDARLREASPAHVQGGGDA